MIKSSEIVANILRIWIKDLKCNYDDGEIDSMVSIDPESAKELQIDDTSMILTNGNYGKICYGALRVYLLSLIERVKKGEHIDIYNIKAIKEYSKDNHNRKYNNFYINFDYYKKNGDAKKYIEIRDEKVFDKIWKYVFRVLEYLNKEVDKFYELDNTKQNIKDKLDKLSLEDLKKIEKLIEE